MRRILSATGVGTIIIVSLMRRVGRDPRRGMVLGRLPGRGHDLGLGYREGMEEGGGNEGI